MLKTQQQKFKVFFFVVSLAVFLALSLAQYIPLRPQSIHQWRQTVSLNITLNFAKQDNSIFQPETNHLNADNYSTGIAQGEFPGFYYVMGKIWKLTGQQEWFYRLVVFGFFLWALFLVAKFLFTETRNIGLSIILPQFIFATPVLAYYSVSFLMDIVAFSLVIFGWWQFYQFFKTKKLVSVYAAFSWFTLAGLLKITLLITPMALIGYVVFASFFLEKEKRPFALKPVFLGGIAMLVVVGAWYLFAISYNKVHQGWYTENGIYPLWLMTAERWQQIKFYVSTYWVYQYAPEISYALFMLILLYFFLHKKSTSATSTFIYIVLAYTFFGNLAFAILWFQVFDEHDYYVIAVYPFFIALLLYTTVQIHQRWIFYRSHFIIFILLPFLFLAIYDTRAQLKYRLSGWPNEKNFASFFDIEPFLRNEIGLSRTDKVVVYNDASVCVSLYLADQKGWQLTQEATAEYLIDLVNKGATHALVNDSSLFNIEGIQKVKFEFLNRWKNVNIYEISASQDE